LFDGVDDEDETNLPDDRVLFESDEGGDDEGKAFLVELRKLVEQTRELGPNP
jgi:hypothetical protein